MEFWFAGKHYNTETMTNLELVGQIDLVTRLELSDEKELRAVVKELRKRIQGGN